MYDIIIGRSESDREKLGKRGTIYLGKQFITMGKTTSLSNHVYMDIAKSHQVFICGKRGGGKCLHGDTLITLDDGTQARIKDLEKDNRGVFSVDDRYRVKPTQKTKFYKRQVKGLLKIKLRSGRTIKLTPEHPLLTIKGWVPAQKLSSGSRIAVPKKISCSGKKPMKDNRVKILAYLLSAGHLSNGFILFYSKDKKIVEDFQNAVTEFDSSLKIEKHSDGCYKIFSAVGKIGGSKAKYKGGGNFAESSEFNDKNSLVKWLEKLGLYGKLSGDKIIPDEIFQLPNKKLSLFLNRFFSCKASLHYDKSAGSYRLSYASSSETLIRQISHLLLRRGILSQLRCKKSKNYCRPDYEIVLTGKNLAGFQSEIGFFGKKFREVPVLKLSDSGTDTIPKEVWEIYRPKSWADIGRQLGYDNPKSIRSSVNHAPSRKKLGQIAEIDKNKNMHDLAESDIFWDEIVSSEKLSGEFTVYDISVPGPHNFVANDIIVHNSYTMGVIAEGMTDLDADVKENINIILLDTMGVYWTMKYPNHKDELLLDDWKLKSKGLDVKIFTPYLYYEKYKKQNIPTDMPFAIPPSHFNASDWCMTFDISEHDPMGVLLERILYEINQEMDDFDIDDIIAKIEKDEKADENVKNALINSFMSTKTWGLFKKGGAGIKDLVTGGQVSVLDVSCYATMPNGWKVKSLVVALVAQKLFVERMKARKQEEFEDINSRMHYFSEDKKSTKQKFPMVWLVIDEAHEFLPHESLGKMVSSDPLITILREGRQPGISMILATQQPGKIHTDVMTQSDTVLSHRITTKIDTEALGMLMQTYMREGLSDALEKLPRVKGAAVIFDDTNERLFPIRVRPRFTWHGGEAPVAVKSKKEKGF